MMVFRKETIDISTCIKADTGKLDYTKVPMSAITAIAETRAYAQQKYGEGADHWAELDNAKERYLAALWRHLIYYTERRGHLVYDEESGLPTMAHILCNAAFLYELDKEEMAACKCQLNTRTSLKSLETVRATNVDS